MESAGARLIIRESHSPEQEYPITKESITIGRETINEVILYDPEASRRHAQISRVEGRYVIEDLGSTNGTFVNGRQISGRVSLNNGDVIDIGESAQLVFRLPGAVGDQGMGPTVMEGPVVPGSDTVIDLSMGPPTAREFPPEEVEYSHGYQAGPEIPAPLVGAATELDAPPSFEPTPATTDVEDEQSRRRLYLGIGCALLVIIFGCVGTFVALDALAPDFLYCGVLEPIFDLLGMALQCS